MSKLQPGDIAPDFELLNQQGESVSLADFRDKKTVVLFFYLKDEGPHCTQEAIGYRDNYDAFLAANAVILGISSDTISSHKLFSLSRRLPYDLLSDPEGLVRKRYGLKSGFWGMNKTRESFVIDKYGKIHLRFSSRSQVAEHVRLTLKMARKVNGMREMNGE